ncbi:MAG: Secretion system C-terminal sorting domain, partial [Bacteroidota bacterium]
MKTTLFAAFFLLFAQITFAQSNAVWETNFIAPSNVIYSMIDSHTDADGNTYLLWIDHDNAHAEYLAKISPTGTVVWHDTLNVPGKKFSAGWFKGNLSVVDDRIVIGAITYPLANGYADATIVVYDTAGQMVNYKANTIWWQATPWRIIQNANHEVWFVYSQGSPFDTAPILYASKFDAGLTLLWTKAYQMPKICSDVAAILDANDNLYVSYSSDNITTNGHNIEAMTRKISPSGQELWLRPRPLTNYRYAAITGSNLVLAGKAYNYTNYASNDTGDAAITFIHINTGLETTHDVYNNAAPAREISKDIQVDGNGDVLWLGVEGVSSITGISSTVVRKYDASGNLIWSRNTPTYPGCSGPANLTQDITGNFWISTWACQPSQGMSEVSQHWRITSTGQIDSTLSHSIHPLLLGPIHSTVDAHGGHYVAYQQAECGGNRVGVFKYGGIQDPVAISEADLPMVGISLAPNPAGGQTTISANASQAGRLSVHVRDVSGKLVYERSVEVNSGEFNLDL